MHPMLPRPSGRVAARRTETPPEEDSVRTLANHFRPIAAVFGALVLSVLVLSLMPKPAHARPFEHAVAWFSFGPVCTNEPGTDC